MSAGNLPSEEERLTRYTAMPFEDQHGNEWPANMAEMRDGEWVRYEDAVTDRAEALADLSRAMQGRVDALTAELARHKLMVKIATDPDDDPSAGNMP